MILNVDLNIIKKVKRKIMNENSYELKESAEFQFNSAAKLIVKTV